MTTATDQTEPPPAVDDWSWRVVKNADGSVTLELGDEYSDLSGSQLTALTQAIGRGLVKLGMRFVESRVEDDEEEGW